MEEQDASQLPQQEAHEAVKNSQIDQLPHDLGFYETPEMLDVRKGLIKALAANIDPIAIKELSSHHHMLGEAIVSSHIGLESSKVDLGFTVAVATIKHAAARLTADMGLRTELLFDYKDQLKDALKYANVLIDGARLPLETVGSIIDTEIDRIYAEVGPRPE
jgi:hypothetical protein